MLLLFPGLALAGPVADRVAAGKEVVWAGLDYTLAHAYGPEKYAAGEKVF